MSDQSRICVFSLRDAFASVPRCCGYEFEDVIREIDAVDMVCPTLEPRPVTGLLEKVTRRLRRRTGWSIEREPKVVPPTVSHEYDLGFFIQQDLGDADVLELSPEWHDRCRVTVCLIEELWAHQTIWPKTLAPLAKFDYLCVYCSGTAEALAKATGRPVFYLAPGVDTLRFCPYPDPPERFIDLYSMGRRAEAAHRASYALAQAGDIHYLYDSAGVRDVPSAAEHRALLAERVKRTRYFVANKAKVDAPEDTQGQDEVGFRFFEGAAGGAILIGDLPNCETFRTLLDWDAVAFQLDYASDDIAGLLREMDGQPERIAQARRASVLHSLRRHDWVYRWETVLAKAGLPPLAAAQERKDSLENRAKMVEAAPLTFDPQRP
ncbi:MAG: glycosyltransferase [Lentisphaerae bacterium]|jgi:hypothetical protein|nr:glycosyltransferase [Lentisphaerota bacterium]MBT4821418.1 glycosyltransferase [Lentisphaerota bacterium]MBT5612607.1 glycosyltransferase [Lentisphaerota bacterium]MBT7059266.1 glycosyltransferase [Lentisphaerota bacterium]MBT7845803.1 glycosyltransferase [Lentisphaerota bacterium]